MSICSDKNSKIKNLFKLQKKSKLRIEQNLIVVEGSREIKRALQGGYAPKELFLCSEICQEKILSENFPVVNQISKAAFEKAAYRKDTEGVIGVFYRTHVDFKDLNISDAPLLLILENIEKPGNLGAILRSAQAASVEVVILSDFKTDLFHPNVIRSSLGTVFTQKIVNANAKDLIPWLKHQGIPLIASVIEKNALNLYDIDLRSGIALVMGSESQGISRKMIKAADVLLQIPMHSAIDSLNVSNAAAVILFEALRQRLKVKKKS